MFVRAKDLKAWYAESGFDPRSTRSWVFDSESLAHFHQEGVKALFDPLRISPEHEVLSLGEGNGAPSRLLAKLVGCKVTGVDVTPSQVATARECAPMHGVEHLVEYIRQDVCRLDLGKRRFDRLYINESMGHWYDKASALKRAVKHLKPGALIGINEWTRGDKGDLCDAWDAIPEFRPMYQKDVWFQSSLGEVCDMLLGAGCKILRAEELTDEVHERMAAHLKALQAIENRLGKRGRLGIPYIKAMLATHPDYLRYGRIIAAAP